MFCTGLYLAQIVTSCPKYSFDNPVRFLRARLSGAKIQQSVLNTSFNKAESPFESAEFARANCVSIKKGVGMSQL